jgi:hypothetical protein
MERKSSAWALGLGVAGLLAVLLVGYVAAYWWRLPTMGLRYNMISPPQREDMQFQTSIERWLFAPAKALHFVVDDACGVSSFNERLRMERFWARPVGVGR